MAKRGIGKIRISAETSGYETETVSVAPFGDVKVILPQALEGQEYTVAGCLPTYNRSLAGDKIAAVSMGGAETADLLNRVPCSQLLGYLPTETEGVFVEVRRPKMFCRILTGVVAVAAVFLFATVLLPRAFSALAAPVANIILPQIQAVFNLGRTPEEVEKQAPVVALPDVNELAVEADTKRVNLDIYNPETNRNNYYMKFDLLLKDGDTNELLYSSDLVEPGERLKTVKLKRSLPKGKYEAIVRMQPYTMTYEPFATASGGETAVSLVAGCG